MRRRVPWWKQKYDKQSICGITRIRLRSGKNSHGLSHSIFLKCKHGFYRSALRNWVIVNLSKETPCPLCREPFLSINVFME